ncbi:MAG: hypothetical protein KFB97_06890 [Cyanobium sp. M30B3]|jgi:hypothetical protein|nr:MAG: hypothetical protein KFB97_06890 [Cyanobium sp. M30B3]
MSIDALQIDTEGYHDEVIYNSNLHLNRPKMIHFESHGLPAETSSALNNHLLKLGYNT